MKVTFVGSDVNSQTSPLGTWKRALSRQGVDCCSVNLFTVSMSEWIKTIRHSNVIIYQGYGKIDFFELRQLSIAAIVGCPIIRKWSGSDVLYALKDRLVARDVKSLDKIISLNLSSEHQGLIDELGEIGLTTTLTSQVIDQPQLTSSLTPTLQKNILVYLPDTKYDFYGYKYVNQLVKDFPKVNFTVVADKQHRLAHFPNVTSLGWVEDMEPVWERVGLLLRITEHDGFPRTIVEALSRRKYVIHNREFKGCWYASNIEDMRKAIVTFCKLNNDNEEGFNSVQDLLSGDSDLELLKRIKKVKPSLKSKMYGLYNVFVTYIYFKTRS